MNATKQPTGAETRAALLKADPALDLRDRNGWSAMHHLASERDWEQADEQLKRGASLEAADHNGESPVWVAVRKGDFETFDFFRRSGALLERENRYGETLLHAAARSGSKKIIQALAEYSDFELIDRFDTRGLTPLHRVAKQSHDSERAAETAALLLDLGANPSACGDGRAWDRNPALTAAMYANTHVAQVLIPAISVEEIEDDAPEWAGYLHQVVRARAVDAVERIIEKGSPDLNCLREAKAVAAEQALRLKQAGENALDASVVIEPADAIFLLVESALIKAEEALTQPGM